MRITRPADVRLLDSSPHTLSFQGGRGEVIQVSALDDDLIRVRHYPDGQPRLDRSWWVCTPGQNDVPLEGRPRENVTDFPCPSVTLHVSENSVHIQTRLLQMHIRLPDFRIAWKALPDVMLAADLDGRAYSYDRAGRAVFHYLERRKGEHYYGFGERSGLLDKAGRRMRMVNTDALGYSAASSDPLYKHFPFYITWLPDQQIAYGLFYDNPANSVFDMGAEIEAYYGDYRYFQAEDGDLDYYFIYGPSIAEVVAKFARLTGTMPLPPRWSLGYLASTMRYTEQPDAQAHLENFLRLCEQHAIPCDMFHLSSGYTTSPEGVRMVFNWNRARVPEPRNMVETFHKAGVRLAANIKPYLFHTHPRYQELAEAGAFIKAADSDSPEISTFWIGGMNEKGDGAYLDFTHPAAYNWWAERVAESLLDYGIDATWNDNNEFQIYDDAARCFGFGQELPIGLLRPIQTLLMVRSSYEAQRRHRPDERPFVLTRSASPGMARYAQSWSGDNATSWETLQYNIPMGLGLSLSGFPNLGHDVGGFAGAKPDPELFVRWIQNGVFHPRFTIHSWNEDGSANEPWMHAAVLPIVRYWMEFRYRLIPYLYGLFHEAAATGAPIIRPIVYEFPQDRLCATQSFDFMLGRWLLVASVYEPGARTRRVYLPYGADWYDFYTGEFFMGGQVIQAEAPLERIPLFVRAGGFIPLGKAMRHIGAAADDLRQVYIFPPKEAGESAITLYEDDGLTLNSALTQIQLHLSATSDTLTLSLTQTGDYPLPYTEIECIFPVGEARRIEADALRTWQDEDGQQHLYISVGA